LGPEQLAGADGEFGTRDTGTYATFHDVVDYFDWLGGQVSDGETRRDGLKRLV
jgi:hypothetical protein